MRNALAVTLLALGILIPQIGLGQAYINSSPNPSNYNQTVTFNTSLNYGCTGIMTIMDQGNTISQGNTDGNGNYSFQTSTLSPGTHSIIAHYDGEGECDPGNSSTLYQVVHAPSTTTSLSSNSNPSTYGGSVTFTATVAPSAATGTVTFKDGSASVGTGTLSRGTATLSISSLTGGSHSITAAYAGDGNYAPSTSSTLAQTVNKALTSTAVVTSSANPSIFGSPVTLSASVTPSSVTGTVTFYDFNGTVTLGAGAVINGQATLTISTLALGANSITATYSGDGNNNPSSSSSALAQTVNERTTVLPSYRLTVCIKTLARAPPARRRNGSRRRDIGDSSEVFDGQP